MTQDTTSFIPEKTRNLKPETKNCHYSAALEARADAVRTAPVDSSGFVLPLPAPAFWKNYFLRIAFGATVDFSGMKVVSTDFNRLAIQLVRFGSD
jgi:hypothetical protein